VKQNSCNGMVDISGKDVTKRRAVASATITFEKSAFDLFIKQGSPKGDVLETAKIAGIMAAKSTPSILPLCHPLMLDKVKVEFEVLKSKQAVVATAEVVSTGKTGVEMEALTAASAACLTIYDMMKWAGQTMTISDIKLLHKSGGKSGTFERKF
jgi:cyclic pyranopterin phosphate synthase